MKFHRDYEHLAFEKVLESSEVTMRYQRDYLFCGSHDPILAFSHMFDAPDSQLRQWYVEDEITEWEFEEALERVYYCNPKLMELV
jgi:succinate dehydrogenase flavin-adding protein (antitoxin of CptAB toxin-antitoxin module)